MSDEGAICVFDTAIAIATTLTSATSATSTTTTFKKVAPCIGDESLPDGMIVTSTSHLPGSGMKLFELCSEGVVDFQASLHLCPPRPFA